MESLFDINALVIQSINLAIIIFVLHRFLFKPYLKYLDTEAAKRVKLEKDIAASTHIVDDAHLEAKKLLDDARLDANRVASDIADAARKDAESMRQDAAHDAESMRQKGFADIDHERKTLHAEMQKHILDVAIKLNEKIFGKNDANVEFLRQSQASSQK